MNRFLSFTNLQKIIETFLIVLTVFFFVASPVHAQTVEWTGVCVGPIGEISPGTDAHDVATIQGLQCLIGNVFTVILTVIGMAGFVMFIIGSFRYLISGGNSKGTETAKHTITFAVIGLVVALSGFILLNLLATFTGIKELTRFTIPGSDTGLQGGNSTTACIPPATWAMMNDAAKLGLTECQ